MIDPDGIPQFDGDLRELELDARSLRNIGRWVRDDGARVHTTWQGLAPHYAAPEAGVLLAATAPVRSTAAWFGADIAAVGDALATFVVEVRPVATRLTDLRTEARTFLDAVAGDPQWQDDPGTLARHDGLVREVGEQATALLAAEARAGGAIDRLTGSAARPPADGASPAAAAPSPGGPAGGGARWYRNLGTAKAAFAHGAMDCGVALARGAANAVGFWGEGERPWEWHARTALQSLAGTAAVALAVAPPTRTANEFADLPGLPRGQADAVRASLLGSLDGPGGAGDPARAAGYAVASVLTSVPGFGAGALARTALTARLAARLRGAGVVADTAHAGTAAEVLGRTPAAEVLGRTPVAHRLLSDTGERAPGVDELPVRQPTVDRPLAGTAPPGRIWFSQHSVAPQTRDGRPLARMVADMRRHGWHGDPVDVVRQPGGTLVSMDNRRLLAAREAGLTDIPVLEHHPDEPFPARRAKTGSFQLDHDIRRAADGTLFVGDSGGTLVIGRRLPPRTWAEAILIRSATPRPLAGSEHFPIGGDSHPPVIRGG